MWYFIPSKPYLTQVVSGCNVWDKIHVQQLGGPLLLWVANNLVRSRNMIYMSIYCFMKGSRFSPSLPAGFPVFRQGKVISWQSFETLEVVFCRISFPKKQQPSRSYKNPSNGPGKLRDNDRCIRIPYDWEKVALGEKVYLCFVWPQVCCRVHRHWNVSMCFLAAQIRYLEDHSMVSSYPLGLV